MGDLLGDLLVGIDAGVHAQDLPPYFEHLAELVVDAKFGGIVRPGNQRTSPSTCII